MSSERAAHNSLQNSLFFMFYTAKKAEFFQDLESHTLLCAKLTIFYVIYIENRATYWLGMSSHSLQIKAVLCAARSEEDMH